MNAAITRSTSDLLREMRQGIKSQPSADVLSMLRMFALVGLSELVDETAQIPPGWIEWVDSISPMLPKKFDDQDAAINATLAWLLNPEAPVDNPPADWTTQTR